MGTDKLGRLSAIFNKGGNFYDFLFTFPAYKIVSEKGSTLKGKNLLPLGANSFLLQYTHFQKSRPI